MAEHRIFEAIKYTFKSDEIRELGEALAREAQTVFDLEQQKKTMTAGMAAQIKGANKRVADLTLKINQGFELREVECLALMETPRPGMKRIIRCDNSETVREEAMTVGEMQGFFGFQDRPDDRPEKE